MPRNRNSRSAKLPPRLVKQEQFPITELELNATQWSRFLKALDRPPKQKKALRKLLMEPSILEK